MQPARLRQDDLHPALWSVLDEYEAGINLSWASTDLKQRESFTHHQRVWWKIYGPGFWRGFAAIVGVFALTFALVIVNDGHPAAIASFGLAVVGASWYSIRAVQANRRTVVRDELVALLHTLSLKPVMQPYVRALIALIDHPSLAEADRRETLHELNRCMNQAFRLELDLENVSSPFAQAEEMDLAAQEGDLRERMDRTSDPITRQAYADSLRLVEGRRQAALARAPYRERGEAQLSMIYQSLSAFAESLERGRRKPTIVSTDLDSLRTRLSDVQSTAEGLEHALQELNATL